MHPLTSIAWPYRWLWTHWVRVFFEVIRWQVVTFQIIAGSSFFSKCMWTKSCSWAALLKFWFQTAWPRIQKFNRLLHAGKAIAFDFFHYNHAVVTFYLQFLCSDWSNLTGEFMRKIYAASGNFFTHSWSWQSFVSSCDVFNCLFPLDVQNEIQLLSRFFCNSWLDCL